MFKYFYVSFLSQIFLNQNLAATRSWAWLNVGISEWANTEIAGSLTGFKCQDFDWQATIGQWEARSRLANQESLYRFTNLILPNIGNKNLARCLLYLIWIVYNASVWQLLVWRFTKYLELKKCNFPQAVLWDSTYIFNNWTQTKNKDLEIIIENCCRQSSQDCLNGPRSIHHRPQFLYRDVLAVAPLKPKYQNTKISHIQARHALLLYYLGPMTSYSGIVLLYR